MEREGCWLRNKQRNIGWTDTDKGDATLSWLNIDASWENDVFENAIWGDFWETPAEKLLPGWITMIQKLAIVMASWNNRL